MRRFLVVALLPLFLYACSIDVWEDGVRMERSESRGFSAYQMRKVEMRTKNGSIESRVWNDDSIHVVFERWATGNDREEALERLDDIKIRISEDTGSGVLSIDVDHPNRIVTNYGCNVYLSLPSSLSLDLESSNGAITIVDAKGNADLWTSNGAITVKNHHGELNAKTSNGAINADVVLPKNGDCILKTSNGAITLSIPDKTSAMMEASTSNGRVEIKNLSVTVIKMEKTDFKGKMGNGEGNIELETSNGNVFIKRSS